MFLLFNITLKRKYLAIFLKKKKKSKRKMTMSRPFEEANFGSNISNTRKRGAACFFLSDFEVFGYSGESRGGGGVGWGPVGPDPPSLEKCFFFLY